MRIPTFHLPEEILSIVLGHYRLPSAKEIGELRDPDFGTLSDHDQQLKIHLSTLANLCLVSRALNRIASPYLYGVFPGFRLVNARLFVKALAKNPSLGDHVHQVVIDKWEHVVFNDDSGAHGIDRSYLSLEAQCARYTQDLRKRSCYPTGLGSPVGSELDSGRADVVLTMLMALCPNVSAIETSVPCQPEDAHTQGLLRAQSLWFLLDSLVWRKWSSDTHRHYKCVRDLSIRLERHSGAFGVLFCKAMLELPSLETLSAWRLDCVKLLTPHPMDVHYYHRDPWPGLKRVELRECRIKNETVGALLLRAPNLRVLDAQWASQHHRLHFGIIGEFLVLRGSNLETIRLDSRQNVCMPFEGDTRPPSSAMGEAIDSPLGSLGAMESLKHLAVTAPALFGYHLVERQTRLQDILPPNIEEITILGPSIGACNGFPKLVPHRDVATFLGDATKIQTSLRRITIECSEDSWRSYANDEWSCSASLRQQTKFAELDLWDITLSRKKLQDAHSGLPLLL